MAINPNQPSGLPIDAHVESVSPYEVKLVETIIERGYTQHAPDKILGDKAYDSDKLDQQLSEERGIELISPHRKGWNKQRT